MPRPLRVIEPQRVYHLISRFVGREWFVESDEDRRRYLRLLGSALVACDWRCLAYAVMSNHVHLAVVAGADPLAEWIGAVHSPFAEWINKRRERIGAVFVRGPRSIAVRPSGVASLLGYIHRNPVRARVADQAAACDWTSHAVYAGLAARPRWLDVESGLALAGFRDHRKFAAWVEATAIDRAAVDAEDVQQPRPHGRVLPAHRRAAGI